MLIESDSTDDDYEADEEDTQEVGYASEPSANILRVSDQYLFMSSNSIFKKLLVV